MYQKTKTQLDSVIDENRQLTIKVSQLTLNLIRVKSTDTLLIEKDSRILTGRSDIVQDVANTMSVDAFTQMELVMVP